MLVALKSQNEDMQESAFTQLKTFYDDTRCVDGSYQPQLHHVTSLGTSNQRSQPGHKLYPHLAVRQLGSGCLLRVQVCTCCKGKDTARNMQVTGMLCWP